MTTDSKLYKRPALCILILMLFTLFSSEAKSQNLDVESVIEWTTAVGKMLYSYHSSYDIAVETIHQQTGGTEIPGVHAGGMVNDGWTFSFGEIDSSGEYVLTYGVRVDSAGEVIQFDHFDSRRVASPHHTLAARALLKVKSDFEAFRSENDSFEAEHFRYAVLPFPRNQLTAFVSPSQVYSNYTLVGNDIMYTLNRSDAEILNRNRFIHSLLRYPYELPEDMHVLMLNVPQNPFPSPVDVMIAMERGEKLAVNTQMGMFVIEPTGNMTKLDDDDPLTRVAQD